MAEIQERHRAVKDLEQSLLELHQIFLDMAVLVEAQGEMLDNIGQQVRHETAYVVAEVRHEFSHHMQVQPLCLLFAACCHRLLQMGMFADVCARSGA